MSRAKAGNPVDTLVGNFDTFVELFFMFMPTVNGGKSDAQAVAEMGGYNITLPLLNGTVNFAFSSTMPDNRLLAYSKGETLEELVEAGSSIAENEQSVTNQALTYVRTEVTGYKLSWGDTRTLLNTAA